MRHFWDKPTNVWVLPERGSEPRMLTESELGTAFTFYDDTGYEPKLDWLYKTVSCSTIDMRELPGLGHLWFDDEGLLRERKISPVATFLYQHCYVQRSPVVGHCVLVVYPEAAKGGLDREIVRQAHLAWEHRQRVVS